MKPPCQNFPRFLMNISAKSEIGTGTYSYTSKRIQMGQDSEGKKCPLSLQLFTTVLEIEKMCGRRPERVEKFGHQRNQAPVRPTAVLLQKNKEKT